MGPGVHVEIGYSLARCIDYLSMHMASRQVQNKAAAIHAKMQKELKHEAKGSMDDLVARLRAQSAADPDGNSSSGEDSNISGDESKSNSGDDAVGDDGGMGMLFGVTHTPKKAASKHAGSAPTGSHPVAAAAKVASSSALATTASKKRGRPPPQRPHSVSETRRARQFGMSVSE